MGLIGPYGSQILHGSVREHREPGKKMKSLHQTLVKLLNPLILKVLVGQGIYIYTHTYIYIHMIRADVNVGPNYMSESELPQCDITRNDDS